MAWEGPPGSIVFPAAGGDFMCPQGWEEDFDRAQMSTQVMIGRQLPSELPVSAPYNLAATVTVPPAAGALVVDPNQETATRIYASKTTAGGVDATIWLGYLNRHGTVSYDSGDTSRGYDLTADVIEHDGYYELPVIWTSGTDHVPSGPVEFFVTSIGTEVPQLWIDTYGVAHYGRMTFQRTDLINTDRDLFEKMADRILEVRGSNSAPRLEAVTIDARTGSPLRNMGLMSQASPEKPSRYAMRLDRRRPHRL